MGMRLVWILLGRVKGRANDLFGMLSPSPFLVRFYSRFIGPSNLYIRKNPFSLRARKYSDRAKLI